jgi:hypothetical protein
MENFEKAFKPFDWQSSIVGVTEDGYKAHVEKVYGTFIDCGTEAGKENFDRCIEKVTSSGFFGKNMANLLKENYEKVMIVGDTDLLVGYILIDQMAASIKYYIDYRVVDQLKQKNETPRTADEIYNFFISYMGFVPLKFKSASLSDLSDDVSYRFETIKRILEDGDNSDAWSNAIKVQLQAGFSHLEYLPNGQKYYFVLQGKHGWYLRADAERNEAIRKRLLENKKKKDDANREEVTASEDVAETAAEE